MQDIYHYILVPERNVSRLYTFKAVLQLESVLHVMLFPMLNVLYRVIHKSLRDFRTRLRNNQDRHGRKEHINR